MRKFLIGFVAMATFLLPVGFVGTADAASCAGDDRDAPVEAVLVHA